MPEQRARVFRATRSPRRSLRTEPRTVATWIFVSGGMAEPSGRCHSTLLAISICERGVTVNFW